MAQSIKYARLEVELGILAHTGTKLSALGIISASAGTICAAMACRSTTTSSTSANSAACTICAALAAAGTMCIVLISASLRAILSLLLRHNAVAMFSSNF